jgi:hypothetical protein
MIKNTLERNAPKRPRAVIAVTGCLATYGLAFLAVSLFGIAILVNGPHTSYQFPSILGGLVCLIPLFIPIVIAIFFFVKAWDFYHLKQSAYWFVAESSFYRIRGLTLLTRLGKELDRSEVRAAFGLAPLTPTDKLWTRPR